MAEADPNMVDVVTATEGTPQAHPKRKRRWGRLVLMLAVPLALIVGGTIYWLGLQGKVSTDNAYVKQDKVSVSSEVGGKVIEVFVHENQMVDAGQLLFRIDPEQFRIGLAQATAQIATAQADVTLRGSDADLSGADIAAARETIAFAETKLARQQALWDKGFTTKADLDAAEHAVAQARETLRAATARQSEARARLARGAAIPGEDPRVAAAEAQRAGAEWSLSRTEVRAPMAGKVGESDRLIVGQQAIGNLPMLTIVARNGTYVEANFKETDLTDMRVGQPARIAFDAYPGVELKGHVASIGAGTASEFSVLPAQNASGNWVKVTQRVPVRIAIDEQSPRDLIAGLSAHITVYTDGRKR
jgi:membrane fusion protein (multidrug efflux system)